jgi:hypothetical protein
MSSSQLLTTCEMHGFRALSAAVGMVLAAVHWLGQGLGSRNRMDKWRPGSIDLAAYRWSYAPIGRSCAPVEPVLWFDYWGGRAGPANWLEHRLSVSPTSHCLARPLDQQAGNCARWLC